jgi:hypothetical protein
MVLCLGLSLTGVAEEEFKTWRAVGGYKVQAAFVKYENGLVTLKKEDGTTVDVRLERLMPRHRVEVVQLAGNHATGSIPKGQITVPTGRRELVWKPLVRDSSWHEHVKESERKALLEVDKNWDRAESEYFIIHYQQVGYAKRVARMADFMYQYIAADLPNFKDRMKEKSHIIVVKDKDDWKEFLELAQTAPQWSGAYVRGMVMFLPDRDDREQNAEILAHEMSHLVLNRFFRQQPPLWMNEGLAEWYGGFGYKAFKGQKVSVRDGVGEMKNPFPADKLMSMGQVPQNEVHRFYRTSHELVGMLMLEKDRDAFTEFLQAITVEGKSADEALKTVYGYANRDDLQKAFQKFVR